MITWSFEQNRLIVRRPGHLDIPLIDPRSVYDIDIDLLEIVPDGLWRIEAIIGPLENL